MILEIPREKVDTILDHGKGDSSHAIREKVITARRTQQERFAGTSIMNNADISTKHIDQFIPLDTPTRDFLTQAAQRMHLSGRVIHRMMKLARTIADYE